jgi:hypothetical protein
MLTGKLYVPLLYIFENNGTYMPEARLKITINIRKILHNPIEIKKKKVWIRC